jgi:hypothetical protein
VCVWKGGGRVAIVERMEEVHIPALLRLILIISSSHQVIRTMSIMKKESSKNKKTREMIRMKSKKNSKLSNNNR